MTKLLPLLLLALVGCQQVDKSEVCAKYNAGLLNAGETLYDLGLWRDEDDGMKLSVARSRIDGYCEFYK